MTDSGLPDQYIDELVEEHGEEVYEGAQQTLEEARETYEAAAMMIAETQAFLDGEITLDEMIVNLERYEDEYGMGWI